MAVRKAESFLSPFPCICFCAYHTQCLRIDILSWLFLLVPCMTRRAELGAIRISSYLNRILFYSFCPFFFSQIYILFYETQENCLLLSCCTLDDLIISFCSYRYVTNMKIIVLKITASWKLLRPKNRLINQTILE